MSLEDSSMWVRIFEGTLSGENFKITEDNRPQVVIPINVFSYYYKVKVETEQAKPWWWLAGTLVERVGTSSEIDRLEINRYVIPSNREILLRPTFNNRAFYYIFEPAYWHTKIFVQLWVYIADPENVQYVNFLAADEPSQGDIWTSLATKNYVQDLFSGHLSLTNPHGITPEIIGAATQQEIDAALTSHLATIDPHPQYLTQERGDISYAPKVATEQAIASHLAATNPHAITPGAIGAATVSHTHSGIPITIKSPYSTQSQIFNILREWTDHNNWSHSGSLIEIFCSFYSVSLIDYSAYFCSYSYAGSVSVSQKIPGRFQPVWSDSVQVSSNLWYRDLSISIPAYQICTCRISPCPTKFLSPTATATKPSIYIYQ